MAWNDQISEAQLRMVYALKVQLGLDPDVEKFRTINRSKAKILIDGLLEEVAALEKDSEENE